MYSATSSFRDELIAIRPRLILLVVVASLTACINVKTPVRRLEVPVPYRMPAQLPPGAERLPIKAAVYYSPEFKNYEHFDRTFGESGIATPVGEFSVRQFNSMLSAMFTSVSPVDKRPPYAPNTPGSNAQIIVETRIERFDLDIGTFAIGPLTARVEYRFKLLLADGTTLATWKISASDTGEKGWMTHGVDFNGARTKALVRKSSDEFMEKFFDAPEVKTWLAELKSKESQSLQIARTPDATFDVNASALASSAAAVVASMTLEGVEVSSHLYWQAGLDQIPIQRSSAKSPVLATRITIENNRKEPIVFDPTTLRLRTNRFSVLKPDSPRTVAERFLRGDGSGGAGAAEIFFGPAVGAIAGGFAEMDQANRKDAMLRKITTELGRVQLEDQTIAPGKTVSGMAYFIALGIDANLDEPELRVSIADPSQRNTYETALNMNTGTGTAGTLVLAKLKPPENISKATSVAAKPKPPISAVASEPESLRVAILPMAFVNPTLPSNAEKELDANRAIRSYIRDEPALFLAFDYMDKSDSVPANAYSVWEGPMTKKRPDEYKLREVAKEMEVDVLVLAWISGNRARPELDLYVYDINKEKLHEGTGNLVDSQDLLPSMFAKIEMPNFPTEAAATMTEPLRVGLLPPYFYGHGSGNQEVEGEIYKEIRRYIASKQNFDLFYDYAMQHGSMSLNTHAVWQGTAVEKVPDKEKIQAIGKELGADVLVLTWIKAKSYGARNEIGLYVFEVASGKMHQGTDVLAHANGFVASMFGPIEKRKMRQLASANTVANVPTEGSRSAIAASVTEQSPSLRQLLSPTEIGLLLTNNTVTGETGKGTRYHVYYRADGTAYGETLSGKYKGDRDDGVWQVTDERGFCLEWTQWLGGEKRCYNVFRHGGRVIFEQNSGHEGGKSSGVIRQGNPENL